VATAEAIPAEDLASWVSAWVDDVSRADASPAMRAIGQILRRDVAAHFTAEQGPDGPWEPRQIDVGLMRGMFPASFSRPLLVLTGDLIEAAALSGVGAINLVEPQSITIGVNPDVIPYAATHQFGDRVFLPDTGKEIDIVPRPYMWASVEAIDLAEAELAEFLLRSIL
jgi:phage gpG-like protein